MAAETGSERRKQMYCKKCGAKLKGKEKYCYNCGAKAPSVQEEQPPAERRQQRSEKAENRKQNGQETAGKEKDNIGRRIEPLGYRERAQLINTLLNIGIAFFCVVILVTSGYIGYKLVQGGKKETDGNQYTLSTVEPVETDKKKEKEKNTQQEEKEKEASEKKTDSSKEDTEKEKDIYGDGMKHSYEVIHDDLAIWPDAEEVCRTLGGHLVTITSPEEEKKIIDYLNTTDLEVIWLGGNDLSVHGQYEWVTGEPMDWDNWPPGEPDNLNDLEHYMVLHKQNGIWVWNNARVDTNTFFQGKMGYIVEWETEFEEGEE